MKEEEKTRENYQGRREKKRQENEEETINHTKSHKPNRTIEIVETVREETR